MYNSYWYRGTLNPERRTSQSPTLNSSINLEAQEAASALGVFMQDIQPLITRLRLARNSVRRFGGLDSKEMDPEP